MESNTEQTIVISRQCMFVYRVFRATAGLSAY